MGGDLPWYQKFFTFREDGHKYFVFAREKLGPISPDGFSLPEEVRQARENGELEFCEELSRDADRLVLRQNAAATLQQA